MLPKQYRLPRSISFSKSNSFTMLFFRVLSQPNELPYNRFGFVISKKVDKRATVRNRLRRVLREIVSSHFPAAEGKDVLFIVKQSFFNEKTETMKDLVEKSLTQIL